MTSSRKFYFEDHEQCSIFTGRDDVRVKIACPIAENKKERCAMNHLQSKSKVFWGLVLTVLCVMWSGGASFVAPSQAAVADSGVQCRVELDKGVISTESSQRAVVKVTLDPPPPPPPDRIERPPVNLSVVLDRSGSMSGAKLAKAKEAAIEALRRLGPRDIFSVVIYDHTVQTIVPARQAINIEWIESRIRQIRAGGNTALFGGVSQGAAEVRKNLRGDYVHRIILLSDGRANVGPSSPNDLGRLGAALMKEHISVTTVGVGYDYNEDLMTRLSQNSDGNSYFVESSEDLPQIFAEELGDVLNVTAQSVRLIIECPNGVMPIRIIGRDGRIRGRTVDILLNQLYGGKEKYALVEVEIPRHETGQMIDVARATVFYINPFTQKEERSTGHTSVRFSGNKEEIRKSANVNVQREYHLNLNAIAQEKAISLSDKGKKKDAVRELKQSADQLREAGTKYNDEQLLHKAEEMDNQATQIEKEGMTPKYRKSLRTNSYQMKNQQ